MRTSDAIYLALGSRLIILFLQSVSNFIIPNHSGSMADVSLHEERQSHSYLIEVLLGGLSSWDGEHYLLIAEQGYKHETNLAFFPLYPILIRAISYTLLSPLLFMGVQMHSVMLIAGVTLTLIAFPMATYQLHKLTDLIYPHRPLLSHITVLLFIINPANIFMSAVYTECLFALFSFACIRYLIAGKTSRACLYLALSCSTRSNGSILCIFIAMYYLEGIVTDFKLTTFIRKSLSCISQLLLGLSPIICYQVYTAHKLDYNYTGILPYSYIQQKHWGIGLMNYYEVKQLPNFMLALPVTTLSILAVWQEVMDVYRTEPGGWSQKFKDLSFAIHLSCMLLIGILIMHIQVMTRFIFSSTPLVYWYAAREIHKCIDIDAYTDFRSLFSSIARLIKGYPSRRGVTSSTLGSRCILVYFLAYTLAGIVLFPNFLPWT